jgi:hypothetical protein
VDGDGVTIAGSMMLQGFLVYSMKQDDVMSGWFE